MELSFPSVLTGPKRSGAAVSASPVRATAARAFVAQKPNPRRGEVQRLCRGPGAGVWRRTSSARVKLSRARVARVEQASDGVYEFDEVVRLPEERVRARPLGLPRYVFERDEDDWGVAAVRLAACPLR